MENQTLSVTVTLERRLKELNNLISQSEMIIEMSKNEIIQLENSAKDLLNKQAIRPSENNTETAQASGK